MSSIVEVETKMDSALEERLQRIETKLDQMLEQMLNKSHPRSVVNGI
jgi:hypothetical protein